MSLADLANFSQIIASIAVVASLIYLAVQVGQTERNQRAMIQQGRADRASAGALALAGPEMASVFRKGMSGDSTLTPGEFDQLLLMCRALLLSGEDSFLQRRAGLLDQGAFDSWVAGARAYMAAPGLRAIWKMTSRQYCDEYRDFINANVVTVPVAAAGIDSLATWQRLLREQASGNSPAA
jgi:hypothetical protein